MNNLRTKHGDYEGARWIKYMLPYWYKKDPKIISPLGERVANLLGELFGGIYHIDESALKKAEWDNNYNISIRVSKNLATYDFSYLTRLVFLCHHFRLRVEVAPLNFDNLTLLFHDRGDDKKQIHKYHPSLDEAVKNFKENVTILEYGETNEDTATEKE